MAEYKKTLTGTIPFLTTEALKFHQKGDLHEAKNIYEQILNFKPKHFDALQLLGILYGQLNEKNKAIDLLESALKIQPDNAIALNNYGVVLTEIHRIEDAYVALNKATTIKPDYAEAFSNKGNALKLLGNYEDALEAYSEAIQINPDYAEAYNNRGALLKEFNKVDEALEDLDKAINLKPNYPAANNTKGVSFLLKGDFKRGWPQYEWRWKDLTLPSKIREFEEPLWTGKESLKGKVILLYSEQGLGDTIQFSRYLVLVKALGAKVVLETHKPLLNILDSIESGVEIIIKGQQLPRFDYQCPLMSLPLAFSTDLKSIPLSNHYILPNESLVLKWKKIIGNAKRPLIGIVWEGNPLHKNDHNRSIPLAELIKYLPEHFTYIGLQKDIRESNLKTLQKNSIIRNLVDDNVSLDETAAIIKSLDIVISVDTSVAHLSAAMGKPTWILLPFAPDWRWLLGRDTSPWYKSAQLFRQKERGSWKEILEDLNNKLNSKF
ncbi:MAG: tetratricopeptide repeat protein [Gammaproteobacteria bacterium]|jgi:tetratricopeptide (TPR) repeat protein